MSQARRIINLRKNARKKFKKLLERQGDLCAECGLVMKTDRPSYDAIDPDCASIEHKVPLTEGGTNDMSNLELVHVRCNLERNKARLHAANALIKARKKVRRPLKIKEVRTCEQCGQLMPKKVKSSKCGECKKAFLFIYAGVGIS